MSARTQITLDPDVRRRAQAKAANLGISFAEYVRRVLADDLGAPKERPDISIFFDLVTGGPRTNVARDKDEMIGEAVWHDHLRAVGRKPRRGKARAAAKRR
jgi:hypothetical protein